MLVRVGTLAVALTVAFAPAGAAATPADMAATHTYLTVGYTTIRGAIDSMRLVGKNINKLNLQYHEKCPLVGLGSLQDEDAQQLSYEVFGALESTGYHTDAKLINKFLRATKSLKWSNPKLTRHVRDFAKSLRELATLPMPDLCADVGAWRATGFKTVPDSTNKFDAHLEAIEGSPPPPALLAPYEAPADKALAARDTRLYTELEHMETLLGQDWWNMTLETLGLNQ